MAAAVIPAALVGALALTIQAPATADRVVLRGLLLASGRWPAEASNLGPDTRIDYPYTSSPFVDYATYEARFLEVDVERVSTFADDIAQEIGWRLLDHTGEPEVGAAEFKLWQEQDAEGIPLWIAAALRDRGVYYHGESLLSRSFDDWLHSGRGEAHLDCDLLAHLFSHVAWRLDLNIAEIPSASHAYVVYRPPVGVEAEPLYVETTNFRKIDADGRRIDYLGEGIGEDFFIDEGYHRSGRGGIRASRSFAQANRLYEPADNRRLADMVVGNVTAGLAEVSASGQTVREGIGPVEDVIRRELLANLEGTHSYVIVNNLYSLLGQRASRALDAGDFAAVRTEAGEARRVRDGFEAQLVTREPKDLMLLANAAAGLGDSEAQRSAVAVFMAWYAEHTRMGSPPEATSGAHAEALLAAAQLDPPPSPEGCEAALGPVLRYGSRFNSVPWHARLCAFIQANPACSALTEGAACP